MGFSRCTVRVMRVVAAICVGMAMTGPVVAYADPAPNSDSSSDQNPSSPFGDKPSSPFGDKPSSPFGDKPSSRFGDKPFSRFGDKPFSRSGESGGSVNSPNPNESKRSESKLGSDTKPPADDTGELSEEDRPNSGFLTPGAVDDPQPGESNPGTFAAPDVSTPDPGAPASVPCESECCCLPPFVDYDNPKGSDWPPPTPDVKVPPPPPLDRRDPPKITVVEHEPPEIPPAVTPEPAPEIIVAGPVAETPAVVEAPAPVPVAVTEVPAAPPPPEVRQAPPVVEAKAADITLSSRVGTGTVALTSILIVLISGVWFYGNRLGSHITVRRNNHV
jgi:hypothetical protein